MNITSYNINDVSYHYIGLRVIAALPSTTTREEQTSTIAGSVRKYVNDKALRLMLPAPRGTFTTIGEKVCHELVHLELAQSLEPCYRLTDAGTYALSLLDGHNHSELRQFLLAAHLRTYDNLYHVLRKHMDLPAILRPFIDADRIGDLDYITALLSPIFGAQAASHADQISANLDDLTTKTLEHALHQHILRTLIPHARLSVPIFRAICDRLVSLRTLNQMRASHNRCQFLKTYATCLPTAGVNDWYHPLQVGLQSGDQITVYLCEPDMSTPSTRNRLLRAVDSALKEMMPLAGYYDLPDLRDHVCEGLRIPEASFDEGINHILDEVGSPWRSDSNTKALVVDANHWFVTVVLRKSTTLSGELDDTPSCQQQ